mmetsp:Transcript_123280/g.227110  ORF Transcript_123280/g.227110 Transcript_123280/m.227110 type:complete len:795 (-) Transcript_123280:144-2528(-)
MFPSILLICLTFHAVHSQVFEAPACTSTDGEACATKEALNQDAWPIDSDVNLIQRTGKKLMEESGLGDHIHHKGSAHAEKKVKHWTVTDSGDVKEVKSPKGSKTPASSPISSSAPNVVKALQEDDITKNSIYNKVLFQIMSMWFTLRISIHKFALRMVMHINRYVLIATICICFIFRFSLQYAPAWVYEALTMKKDAGKKNGPAKMPFSHYIGRGLHFTTPAANPTWLYTTSRNWGQSTVLRASLWFTILVPFILFLWTVVSSASMHRFLSLGLSNIGIFQIGITALYNIVAPWPQKETKHVNNPEYVKKIGCIVPCHQSADEIATTVKSLLQFFEPEHIVVVDNGNSVKPLDDTYQRIQDLEPRVKYMWVPIGMKTNALWMGLNNLPSTVEYVMHIDDDTELPVDMVFDEKVWENEHTDAVSYGIQMYQTGWVEKFVDFEFKQFSQMRLFQSNMSTVWFQHGIIGIWRRPAFTEILKEHPFLPFGEDNWNGTINLLKNRQMRQELRSCAITYAPATLLPVTGSRQQGYGAANIWKQRADRWCVNAPRRFWIRFYLMLFYRMDTWRGAIVFKLISLEHLVGIIAHLCIPLALIKMIADAISGNGYPGHVMNQLGTQGGVQKLASLFLPLLACSVLDSLFQNYVCWAHRPDIRVDLKTALLYPFYQSFLMICCWYGHWRCLFWYIPFVPMRHGLYTEGSMNPELLKQIHKIDTVNAIADESCSTAIIDGSISKGFIKTDGSDESVSAAANSVEDCNLKQTSDEPSKECDTPKDKSPSKDDADAAAGTASKPKGKK